MKKTVCIITILLCVMLSVPQCAMAEGSFSASLSNPESVSCNKVNMTFKIVNPKYHYSYVLQTANGADGPFTTLDSINQSDASTSEDNEATWYRDGKNEKSVWYYKESDEGKYSIYCFAPFGRRQYYRVAVYENTKLLGTTKVVGVTAIPDTPFFTFGYQVSQKKAVLHWSPSEQVNGYTIERKKGNSWKAIKTVSGRKLSFTDKKLKKGKTYYYRVRSFKTLSGKRIYSGYSKTFKIKIKKSKAKGSYKSGKSVYGSGLKKSQLQAIRDVVQTFKDNHIKKGLSAYRKVQLAFLYVRVGGRYSMRSKGFATAWGALVKKSASCYGYARGFKALCDGIGIPCKIVDANKKAVNPNHEWAIAKINGKWYICDPQAGFFLAGGRLYKQMGLTWNTKKYPKVCEENHPDALMYDSIL